MEDIKEEYYRKIVCVSVGEASRVSTTLPVASLIFDRAIVFKSNLSVFTDALVVSVSYSDQPSKWDIDTYNSHFN